VSADVAEILRHRNVVLIASGSSTFIEIVGIMVAENGFSVATASQAEPSWLALTRTQPVLVICDRTGPELDTKGLIVETLARGLPLLVVASPHEHAIVRTWRLPDRCGWLEFPIASDQFGRTLNALMLPRRPIDPAMLAGANIPVQTMARRDR